MTQHHPVHEAVAALIRTQSRRIQITQTIGYTVRSACLLQQLAEAIGVGMEKTGGSGKPGSRPPIAVEVWDLWVHIVHSTNSWAAHLRVDRSRYSDSAVHVVRDGSNFATPGVGRLLRAVAAAAVSQGKEAVADAIQRAAEKWHRQILAMLHGQVDQRPVRGANCFECQAVTVAEERDGEGTYRVPAIVLITDDQAGVVNYWLACRACGWNEQVNEYGTALVHTTSTGDPGFEVAA